MHLIPTLRKQKQVDLCELEASLVYRVSSRTARATQRNPVSERGCGEGEREREKNEIVNCVKMDGPGGHYIKRSEPGTERQFHPHEECLEG